MGLFTQIVILMVVLACMVMVLLAIRQLTHFESFDDLEETSNLKKEVDGKSDVLSNNNIFSTLIETTSDKGLKKGNYKSNSKDPFSRSE